MKTQRIYTLDGLLRQWSRKNPRVRDEEVHIRWADGSVVVGHVDFHYVHSRSSLIEVVVTHIETRVLIRKRIVEARGYR